MNFNIPEAKLAVTLKIFRLLEHIVGGNGENLWELLGPVLLYETIY